MLNESQPPENVGLDAASPWSIPRAGLKQVLRRVWREVGTDHIALVSAGVAFYGLLAFFPAVAALLSLYGLVADPAEVSGHVQGLVLFPAGVRSTIVRQLQDVAASSEVATGAGFLIALIVSLWSSSRGTKAVMTAINIAYEEKETRSLFRLNILALGFTTVIVVTGVGAIALIGSVSFVLKEVDSGFLVVMGLVVPWVVLIGAFLFVTAFLYRHTPCRSNAQWKWVTPGSFLATGLWVIASFVFSAYVANFGNYNEVYGSVGATIVLLLWFWVSAFAVMLGAELNAELEYQTRVDTTSGPPMPLGERGAVVADTVPPALKDAMQADSKTLHRS